MAFTLWSRGDMASRNEKTYILALVREALQARARGTTFEHVRGEVDTTIGIAVDSLSHIPHTSLDTTLQAIIDTLGKRRDFQGPDLVIVSYGNERGMTMRLFPGHRTDSRSTVLRTLMDTTLSTAQIAKPYSRRRPAEESDSASWWSRVAA
jgi:hypothetical protein